jgi:hypothetical protein
MRGYADPYAHRYVDPFAHRVRAMASFREDPSEGGGHPPEVDPAIGDERRDPGSPAIDDDDEAGTLDAIAEDQLLGRREAPFAGDPRHRVRPVGK